MPGLSKVFIGSPISVHSEESTASFHPIPLEHTPALEDDNGNHRFLHQNNPFTRDTKKSKKKPVSVTSEESVLEDKIQLASVLQTQSSLPFLLNSQSTLGLCRVCGRDVKSGQEVLCGFRGCREPYHITCAKERLGFFSNSKGFKCPQHACFVCKQKGAWRCIRCTIASHPKCAPWQDKVTYLKNQPGRAVCWRHPADWHLDKKHAVPTSDIEEIFSRLPVPYVEEQFEIDSWLNKKEENKSEPTPYVHIRRNLYLVKKKRDDSFADIGCTNCKITCYEDCVCRSQSISCSKACNCSRMCTNRPFRKEKKVKVVKTKKCGWGVEAAESIKDGDFIIEYVGEVINEALCAQRLWDLKDRGDHNFYLCEIRKDFTIDATYKGNVARFLNHSCNPNCKLEKWQVDGDTRLGVFAARTINVGEPLTYDYRFVHFGPKVKCCCGASNCQGYLGLKKRNVKKMGLSWGSKRTRSPYTAML